jgi:hypothetical protein
MTRDQYFLAVTAIQNKLHAYILSLLADPVAARNGSASNGPQRQCDDDQV